MSAPERVPLNPDEIFIPFDQELFEEGLKRVFEDDLPPGHHLFTEHRGYSWSNYPEASEILREAPWYKRILWSIMDFLRL